MEGEREKKNEGGFLLPSAGVKLERDSETKLRLKIKIV